MSAITYTECESASHCAPLQAIESLRVAQASRKESDSKDANKYLLNSPGITLEAAQLDLEALARDKVYEFVFIGTPLKLWGATGPPMRPLAIPMR